MKLRDYWVPIAAAREVDLPRKTLESAIDRGDVPTETLGCGTRVVRMKDVRKFMRNRPKRGRKPKSAT